MPDPELNPNEDALFLNRPPSFFLLPLFALCLILFVWSASHSDFSKREAREALPIVKMYNGEGYFLAKLNEKKIRTKPPLFYWSGLTLAKLSGGPGDLAIRMTSVFAGVGTLCLTWALGTWLFSPLAALFSVLILATCWRFAFLASHARIDMELAFFTMLALAAAWQMLHGANESRRKKAGWVAALAMGLAVLTKGPFGLLLPVVALIAYAWKKNYSIPWFRFVWVSVAVISIWLVPGYLFGGEEFRAMIYNETVGRATGTTTAQLHREAFYYYIPQIFAGLAPWSFFLPLVLWFYFKNPERDPNCRYPALAAVSIFIFLSVLPGKRGDYLLPLYPFAALMLGEFFARPPIEDKKTQKGFFVSALPLVFLATVLALGLLVAKAFPHVDPAYLKWMADKDRVVGLDLIENDLPSAPVLIGAGLALLAAGFRLFLSGKRGARREICVGVAGFMFLCYFIVYGPGADAVNRYNSLKPFAEKVRQVAAGGTIYLAGSYRENLAYYVGLPVRSETPETAFHYALTQPKIFVLIKSHVAEIFLKNIPDLKPVAETEGLFLNYQLIARQPLAVRATGEAPGPAVGE